MSPNRLEPSRAERFSALYDDAYVDVLRFVTRRTSHEAAEDVAHEVFLTAWRRFDTVPTVRDEARAWLFGTARNCLLREWREHGKRDALGVRIADAEQARTPDLESLAADVRLDLSAAWKRLDPSHQEVLSLAIWEQLPSALAGSVLGISAQSYRVRLHRARAALREHLERATPPRTSPSTVTEQQA
ncbi:RNA polymerase subunit sigma-70 [Pseudoclavibacter sp. RFBG4]|uniref:RNA polymerase sigma factor n=1 Tax=unclassified Pseudoclavibacter TaxID=2615177 RepID=UPI000CE9258A|nr:MULTISPECIES: RNA polymerase sigma factor [unclassified Pseudoclavibacter]MBF4548684.1 RNA polymerase sigma factor [Pseudoclavibacter sp. VKM Ac-2888]PPG31527.1 RNA polymerase subunit sigma-70 [Pseudoclavibacter sp. RFBG4]